jgi:aspartate carbamoyltransferase catalytic subunit
MPEEYKLYCKEHNIKYVEHEDFNEDVIAGADILYMTRVQKERFDETEYKHMAAKFVLELATLEGAKPTMKILHPLPRVDEIEVAVDKTPHAYYFQQAENGVYARQALLALVLNETV